MTEKVDKPWGYELIWAHTKFYAGKILHINEGHCLSLQYHNFKAESLLVYKGRVQIELDGEVRILNEGDSIYIKPGMIHRTTAIEEADIFEVSTPQLDDIVRLQDNYGRIKEST